MLQSFEERIEAKISKSFQGLEEKIHLSQNNSQRVKYVDKGMSYISAFFLIGFLVCVMISYDRRGLEPPTWLLVSGLLLIAAALGINTQGIAEAFGKFLSK